MDFFDRIDSNVTGPGDGAYLAVERVLTRLEHFVDKEGGAIAGRFGTHQRTAPVEALAGEHARFPTIGNTLVLAKHVADFTAANTDITCGDIRMLTDVTVQFSHEALTEAHDFIVGFTFRIEIRATFAATNRQTGQGILEYLFKTKELDNAEINRRVEAKTALVWAEGAVELNTESAIDLNDAFIILPRHPKDDLSFRLTDAFNDPMVCKFRMFDQNRT